MANRNTDPAGATGPQFPPAIIAFAIFGLFAAITWWQNNQRPQDPRGPEPQTSRPDDDRDSNSASSDDHVSTLPEIATGDHRTRTGNQTEAGESDSRSSHRRSPRHDSSSNKEHQQETTRSSAQAAGDQEDDKAFQVPNQSITNLNGKVVFRGTIDLKPTLDRIERGEANRHRNDGTTFQNREGRLPKKSSGYYKEYVHPTPGESGPGPQRIILGKEGEIWYTPDHYKTFMEIPQRRNEN